MKPLRSRVVLAGIAVLVLVAGVIASLVIIREKREEVAGEEEQRAEQVERADREMQKAARARIEAQLQREAFEQQARVERQQREEAEREAVDEKQRLAAQAEHGRAERRREAAARREEERRLAELERLAREKEKEEEERLQAAELQAQREAEERAKREADEKKTAAAEAAAAPAAQPASEADVDDTPAVETETSIDDIAEGRGWSLDFDARPIVQYEDEQERDGTTTTDGNVGARLRLLAIWGITEKLRIAGRLAGVCFTGDCDLDFVLDQSSDNGLSGGQFTLDELFVHWFRRARFDVAVGRLQTRFVLRGGVYAKSLDRNDSNNVNVTWTDGLQGTFRAKDGWTSSFVLQRNAEDGTGSIRQGPLDFSDGGARNTYFFGIENIRALGPISQRAFDVSYLPDSLLKDGDLNGRREDYWALVGRLAFRWPQRTEGLRLRAGAEVGYAPVRPTAEAVGLAGSGDVNGLAWDVVVSAMDFAPRHSVGLNYARTGPAWFLSPQFRPNDELIEIRYQWRPEHFPLLETRVRRREDIEQLVGTAQKRDTFDFYLRLTWQLKIKDY